MQAKGEGEPQPRPPTPFQAHVTHRSITEPSRRPPQPSVGAHFGSWEVELTQRSPANFSRPGSFSAFSARSQQAPHPWPLSHTLDGPL